MTERGFFVVFEGGEGSGKSTQARLLALRINALLTHEPGDTPIGSRIRAIALEATENGLVGRAEALLMAADRAQHSEQILRPTLEAGLHVVCDRFTPSSVAYQGAARGLGEDSVAELSSWATEGLQPDLVVLLDLDLETVRARIGAGRDRLETAGSAFHAAVAASYRRQASADRDRWAVIDAAQDVEKVQSEVDAVVAARLGI